jgi:hypothetical protein
MLVGLGLVNRSSHDLTFNWFGVALTRFYSSEADSEGPFCRSILIFVSSLDFGQLARESNHCSLLAAGSSWCVD